MSYTEIDRWGGDVRAEKADAKGGVIFRGTSCDNNTAVQININLNFAEHIDPDSIQQVKELFEILRKK